MTRTVVILILAAAIAGCSSPSSPSSNGGPGGSLFVPDTVNFGSLASGQMKDTVISIFNETSAPITITGNSLSSTQAEDTNFSHSVSIAPGYITIHIEFTASNSGANSAMDSIRYQSAGKSYVTVMTLEANSSGSAGNSGSLFISPPSIDFGTLPIGQWHDTTIFLFNTGNTPLSVTSSSASSSELQDTNFTLPVTINGGGNLPIHVQFNPALAGLRTAVDSIHYIAGSSPHTALITMTARGSTAVSNTPGPGSTYTYAVDTNGVPQGDSTYTILSNSFSFQGKTDVIEILGETGDTNYYHIESNGDVSIFFNFSALARYVSIPSSWLTIPFGSKQTQSTSLLNDPTGSISFSGITIPGTITVTSIGTYSGPGNISAAGQAFATQKGSIAINFNFQGSFQGIPVTGSQNTTITMWYAHTIGFYPKRQDVTTSSNTLLPTPSTSTTNYLLTSDQVK